MTAPRPQQGVTREVADLVRLVRIRQRALGIEFRHRWSDIAHEPIPEDMLAALNPGTTGRRRKKSAGSR